MGVDVASNDVKHVCKPHRFSLTGEAAMWMRDAARPAASVLVNGSTRCPDNQCRRRAQGIIDDQYQLLD